MLTQHQGWVTKQPSFPPKASRLGGGKEVWRDPNWPKAYPMPYIIVLNNKSWRKGKKKEEEELGVIGVCLPKQPLCTLILCFPDICLMMRNRDWISAFIPHVAFTFVIKLPLCQPMSFPILMSSPVVLRRGSERVPGLGSGASQGQTTTNNYNLNWCFESFYT